MDDGVKVELNALTTFAGKLAKAADGHFFADAVDGAHLTGLSSVIKTSTGAQDPTPEVTQSGFFEAQDFATRHHAMAESVQAFLTDAVNGVVTLAAAAETCAVRYAGTDAANAALMQQAGQKFDKAHLFSGLMPTVTGSGTVSSDAVNAAFTPTDKREALPLTGSGTTTAAPAPTAPTTKPTSDDEFTKEIARKKQALEDGEEISPPANPTTDPGDGMTIGQAPDVLVVPPDSVKIPVTWPMPVTPHTAG
jgi:hypothetical protein